MGGDSAVLRTAAITTRKYEPMRGNHIQAGKELHSKFIACRPRSELTLYFVFYFSLSLMAFHCQH
jgi:hypothetical protein